MVRCSDIPADAARPSPLPTAARRAAGLALGYLADRILGDPRRGHPVAWFGTRAHDLRRWMQQHERLARTRTGGVTYVGVLVGGAVGAGVLAERVARRHGLVDVAVTAAATWTVLGGMSLAREGAVMAELLDGCAASDLAPAPAAAPDAAPVPCSTSDAGPVPSATRGGDRSADAPGGAGAARMSRDARAALDAARARLSHLCSRDAAGLMPPDLARAATESLAENTSDAVTAPLFWGAVAGVPGLLGYRAANTLDAMVGYRTPELREFGWAAARFDDLLNLVPARLTAALTVVLAPAVGGSPSAARRAWRRDAPRHPSPNAGPVEATAAGALGVRLGGSNTYDGETEDRGTLGSGRPVEVSDLPRAVRLSTLVSHASLGASIALTLAIPVARAVLTMPTTTSNSRQRLGRPRKTCCLALTYCPTQEDAR